MSELDRAIAAAKRDLSLSETATRRRIVTAYRQTITRLRRDLTALQTRIGEARALGEPVNPDWLRREWRYQRLIQQARLEYARFAADGIRVLQTGQVQAVAGGAHLASELAGQMGVRFGANINTQAMERLIAATDRGPVRGVLDGYGSHAADVIERELTTGLAAGVSPRQITRDILRQISAGGVEARIAALTRTELMRSFNGSLSQSYQAMGDVLSGVRWVAAKSERTCLACLQRDGHIYPVDYRIQSHVNCRCVLSPVPKGVRVPYESGEDWFARQPADVQRRMMPTEDAYQAYRDGRITLADFTGVKRSRIWGTSVYQRSAGAVLGRQAA